MDSSLYEKINRLLENDRLSLDELRDIKKMLENLDDDSYVKELKLKLGRRL